MQFAAAPVGPVQVGDGAPRRARPAAVPSPEGTERGGAGVHRRASPRDLLRLQRTAGNAALASAMASRNASPTTAVSVQLCGDVPCDCSDAERAEKEAAVQRMETGAGGRVPVQRSWLSEAWDEIAAAGPAAMRAARVVETIASNPSGLPVVLTAIAWEEIPETLKGPLIDRVLQACLTAARTVELPSPPGVPVGGILQHVAIGALERALSYPAGMKVHVANRMAQIVINPSPEFSLGFLKGLVLGLWDGITGPFVLIRDLVELSIRIQSAEVDLLSRLAHADSRRQMMQDVSGAIARIEPRAAQAWNQLTAGQVDPQAIMSMIDQLVASALHGVEALGASLSDALLTFMNRPDRALGEGVGWVAGTATFEVLLLVLTEGGYTVVKNALEALRVAVRATETGAAVLEAFAPLQAAFAAFRAFAASNRALGPLIESIEEVVALFMRYLRFSYGLHGEGAAVRTGERAAGEGERAASREIQVADTALGETHEITRLADGTLVRCSDRCMRLVDSIAERAPKLVAAGMPEESARLTAEAEAIAADSGALAGNRALSAEEREARETALLRRAESLERQTAAAEREVLNRLPRGARKAAIDCRAILRQNADMQALRRFEGQVANLEKEVAQTVPLLDTADPAMREVVANELNELEQQGRDLERQMREYAPAPGPAPSGRTYDPSPKHAEGGAWGTPMDLDDATAQRVLDGGIVGPNGRQVYGLNGGKIYEFQPDGVGGFHGYPIPGTEAPVPILRQWRGDGLITEAEYRRMLRGRQ